MRFVIDPDKAIVVNNLINNIFLGFSLHVCGYFLQEHHPAFRCIFSRSALLRSRGPRKGCRFNRG